MTKLDCTILMHANRVGGNRGHTLPYSAYHFMREAFLSRSTDETEHAC
jgi:hypothetical protein